MPTKPQTSHPTDVGWLVCVKDNHWILYFNPERCSVSNLRLHKEYPRDSQFKVKHFEIVNLATYRRFGGDRVLQLELGVRVIRAFMSENNRTTIADGFPRSRSERMKGLTAPPSKRTFRQIPWFLEAPDTSKGGDM